MNMSLYKVPWPLTYRSLPSLPSERLCFPRGPCSGFHCPANKATLHFSHETSWGRGKETRHCATMTYLPFTFKRVHEYLRPSELVYVHRGILLSIELCVFTCVCTINCVCIKAREEVIENLRANKRREHSLLPTLWYFSLCTGFRT